MKTLGIQLLSTTLLLAALPACSDRPVQTVARQAPTKAPAPKPEEMGWLVPGLPAEGNWLILAWNRHDAKAFGALWREGGDFIDPAGRLARGREQIEALFERDLSHTQLHFLGGTAPRPAGLDVRLEEWDVEAPDDRRIADFPFPRRAHLYLVWSGSEAAGWRLRSLHAVDGNGPIQTVDEYGDAIRPVGGEVTAPEPLFTPPPAYTEMARRARFEGYAVLDAVIDERGAVTVRGVIKPIPLGLDQEAEKAARRWKFKPATLHGKPVQVTYPLKVSFHLPAEPGKGKTGGSG